MRQDRLAPPNRLVILGALSALLATGSGSRLAGADGWSHYGASLGGDRYAAPLAITPENVGHLSLAWVYRTGGATDGRGFHGNPSRLQATPILVQGKLIASTGFNRVFALDPATGAEIWTYDPEVDFSRPYSEPFASRGVAAWHGRASAAVPCRTRVFLGTLDARLIALDADRGTPCADFGNSGEVDLSAGIRGFRPRDYSVTSPPAVVGDLVIVGSAIGDNGAAEVEPGVVRAYDVRDGSPAWAWDPLPRSDDHPAADGWEATTRNRTGGANVWSVMSADPERDLVFLPTTSPSPDFYGSSSGATRPSGTTCGTTTWPHSRFCSTIRRETACKDQPWRKRPRPGSCSCWTAKPASRCTWSRSGPCPAATFPVSGPRGPNPSRCCGCTPPATWTMSWLQRAMNSPGAAGEAIT